MGQEDLNIILETLKSQNTLYLLDKKIVRPFAVPGSMAYERYRTKIVKDLNGNDIMRVDYDMSSGSQGGKGLFNKIQQLASGLLNFKLGDLNGNYLYSIKAGSFMTVTHNFRIMNGEETQDDYAAVHRMMSLGKESLVLSNPDGAQLLSSEYRGYRKLIEVRDSSQSVVSTLHAPIISMRDRWQLDFSGECDRSLVLIMVAIMSEMGER